MENSKEKKAITEKQSVINISLATLATIIIIIAMVIGNILGPIALFIATSIVVWIWRELVFKYKIVPNIPKEKIDITNKESFVEIKKLQPMKNPLKVLSTGYRRLIIVCSFIIPLLFSYRLTRIIFGKHFIFSEYLTSILMIVVLYWILVFAGIWIYKGFKSEKK